MMEGKDDGVSTNDSVAKRTLLAIEQFNQTQPTIYLPTYDPDSAHRLVRCRAIA
jgi:N-acyl homoserine lactone hydrolase